MVLTKMFYVTVTHFRRSQYQSMSLCLFSVCVLLSAARNDALLYAISHFTRRFGNSTTRLYAKASPSNCSNALKSYRELSPHVTMVPSWFICAH